MTTANKWKNKWMFVFHKCHFSIMCPHKMKSLGLLNQNGMSWFPVGHSSEQWALMCFTESFIVFFQQWEYKEENRSREQVLTFTVALSQMRLMHFCWPFFLTRLWPQSLSQVLVVDLLFLLNVPPASSGIFHPHRVFKTLCAHLL